MVYIRFILVFVLLSACIAVADDVLPWRVGLASRDITPTQPVRMAGYGSKEREQSFEGVASKLHAKAMAIEDESGKTGLLITTDLIGLTAAISEPLYARIAQETGLSRKQILINSSHTHAGPTLRVEFDEDDDFSKEQAEATKGYTEWLRDQIVELGVEATKKKSAAKLSWGVGIATFVMNRREHTQRGVRLGVNPSGLADRSVPVLRIEAADGTLRGVLFGAACHNTTLTHRDMQISGDYAGHAQRFIEDHFPGAQAMFMQGCGGDANPYPRGSEEIARIHGMTLGSEVARVLEEDLLTVTGTLRTLLTQVKLPLNRDLEGDSGDALYEKLEKASGSTASVARQLREKQQSGELMDHYESPIGLWQFGSGLTLAALPAEVVVDYVPLIENAIGPRQLWVSAYNHDVFGYIPSARTLEEGGYEMRGVYYGGPGIFAPSVEQVIIDHVYALAIEAGRPKSLIPSGVPRSK